jgi:glycosyltransferase involved in cell wall biosynthesis
VSTSDKGPLVTIGMPIYNEERYLEQALDSLRAQNYKNIQILISDNASTDRSGEISSSAAEKDARIQYFRVVENIGAAANFRRVVDMAEGQYFMWAAGHDEWSESLISDSVAALEENESAAIAFASSYWIGEDGQRDDRDTDYPDTRGMSLFSRFYTVFWGNMHPVLSLMRRSYLQKTRGMQSFAGADLVLLSDLILMGDFVHAENAWWHRRDVRTKETHSERMKRYTGNEFGQAKTPLDKRFPLLRLPIALLGTIRRARISWLQKFALIVSILPMMPVRYVVGRRKANSADK